MEVMHVYGFDHIDQTGLATRAGGYSVAYTNYDISTTTKRTGRGALDMPSNANNILIFDFMQHCTQVTVGFAFYTTNLGHGGFLFGERGDFQFSVELNANGSLSAWRGDCDGGGTKLGTSGNGIISESNWYYIEIAVHCHNSLGGYEVRVDGQNILSDTGVDTQYVSNNWLTRFAHSGTGGNSYIDDMYILSGEHFLGDCQVDTLYPTGAGNYTQWTPSGEVNNWDCVNEEPQDNADYIIASGEDIIDTYTFDQLEEFVDDNIHAVSMVSWGGRYSPGVSVVSHFTRIGSSDYSGENQYQPLAHSCRETVWTLNPDDSAAWERTDVNNAEFGIKKCSF